MKKKWMAACGVTAFFLSAGIALWMEKPALTQMAGQAITTTANSKLNGTLSFSSLDISLKGQLVLAKPVIRDTQGRVVIEGDAVRVYVNPGKIVNALKQGEILQALDTADVDNPVLHLWQNEDDGTWNVASLIKKDQRQTDAGFRGAINVHYGTIDAVLPDSTAVIGQNVNGSVSFAGYPSMAIDASMTVDGQKVTAHGTYASNRQYDFTLSADAVNGTYASSFIPASADVVIRSGTVENVKVRVADSHNGFFLSGQADVTDGHVTVQGLDVNGLKGHAALTTQDITLSGVEGRVNDSSSRWDDVVYQPGKVEAIGWKDGKKVARETIKTSGPVAKIEACLEKGFGEGDLYYIDVKLTDKKGNFVPTACDELKFSVTGPGEILAVDAGDPTCLTPFHSDTIKAFNGLASVIIKVKPGAKGKIVVTATSDNLKKSRIKIKPNKI